MDRNFIFYDIVRCMAPVAQVQIGGKNLIGKAVEFAAKFAYTDSSELPEGDLNQLAIDLMEHVYFGKPAPEWLVE